jgi:hypothetical protein
MARSLSVVVLGLVLGLCKATPVRAQSAPDWVQGGRSKSYPAARYLIGVGSGSSLDGARDSARGDLAKQFSVKIDAVLETEQASESVKTNDGRFVRDLDKTRNEVRTRTQETLQGVLVPETYADAKTGLTYALAVLEREPAAQRIATRIAEIDKALEAQLKEGNKPSAEKLPRIRSLTNARRLVDERDILNTQLIVIDASGRGRPSSVDRVKISDAAREALAALSVFIDSATPLPADIQSGIEEVVAQEGLSLSRKEGEADLVLHVDLTMQVTDRRRESGFIYGEGVLTASLEAKQSNQPAFASRQSAKDGGKTEAEATRKANRRLRDKIVLQLKKDLNAYLAPT